MNESREAVQADMTYRLGSLGGEAYIECLVCHLRSFHVMDISNLCCGRCRRFHRKQYIGAAPVPLGETDADSILKLAKAKLLIAQAARLDRSPDDKPLILAARAVCSAWDSEACVALPRFACLVEDLRVALGGFGPRDPTGDLSIDPDKLAEAKRIGQRSGVIPPDELKADSCQPSASEAAEPAAGSWKCAKCKATNPNYWDRCSNCVSFFPGRRPKPEAVPPAEPAGKCRVCGCTQDDCSDCVEQTGEPCHWVEPDLCSRCADPERPPVFSEVGPESADAPDTQADAPQPSPVSAQTGEIKNPPGSDKQCFRPWCGIERLCIDCVERRVVVIAELDRIKRNLDLQRSREAAAEPAGRAYSPMIEHRDSCRTQLDAWDQCDCGYVESRKEAAEPAGVQSWQCDDCGAVNNRVFDYCGSCRKHKPIATADHSSRTAGDPTYMPLGSKRKELIPPEAGSPEPTAPLPLHASRNPSDAPEASQ